MSKPADMTGGNVARQKPNARFISRSKRLNGLIVAAALTLLVLGAGIGWQAFDERKPGTPVALADVEEIRIERAGEPVMVLRGDDDAWRIEQPWSLPANRQRVEPLLSALAMGGEGYAPEEVDIGATGLVNPAVTLQIDGTRIDIGATDVSGTRRYARRNGRIVLIDDWLSSLIEGGVTAMARLTPFDGSLTGVQASLATRKPVGDEAVIPGDAGNADGVTLDEWQSLSARQIVAWPIEDDATVNEQTTLEATLGEKRQRDYDLVQTERYTALHPVGTGFAYVFANEDWPCPDSAQPVSTGEKSIAGC